MNRAIPPLSQYAFMAWCSVKHRDNFNFTFTVMEQFPFCVVSDADIFLLRRFSFVSLQKVKTSRGA
jgi:hypothetical protein